jgi:hypothetical protein
MSEPSHKSIAVDHETWETLTTWADNECRTVSGQIKFLVRKFGPKPINKQKFLIEGPLIDTEAWTQKKCSAKSMVLMESQRGRIIDALMEYSDPITNTELTILVGDLPVEAVAKQTAGMYKRGLLKRRDSLSNSDNDKYEYQLTTAAHRLVKRRDKKRAAIEKRNTLSN